MKNIRGIILFIIRSIWKLYNYIYYIKSQILWCTHNSHNNTRLVFNSGNSYCNVEVWSFSYWPIDFRWDGITKLIIWNYVAIAWDVIFIWNEHNTKFINQRDMNWVFFDTIYNKLLNPKYDWPLFPKNQIWKKLIKWNIVVNDEVWIWTWAKIMSWVHIHQWAVVAAGAVVTKDVPPYAIVGWVPAKVIKYRFPDDKIKKLLKINYSTTPLKKFWEIYPEMVNENPDIDHILKELNK